MALRVVKNLLWRAVFVNDALVKVPDAIRDVFGKAHLVGHDEHGHAVLRQSLDDAQDLAHHGWVKSACGLVEQNDLGLHCKGARDGHALFLPARELAGHAVFLLGQANGAQELHGALAGLVA